MTVVRLERLNEVQYAYDESRKAALEEKGFKVVSKPEEKPKQETRGVKKAKPAKGDGKDVG